MNLIEIQKQFNYPVQAFLLYTVIMIFIYLMIMSHFTLKAYNENDSNKFYVRI